MTVRVDNIDAQDLDDLAEIDGQIIIGAGDAAVGNVMAGKTFYAGSTTLQTGTLPTEALDPSSTLYPAGYHTGNAGGLPAVETDLVTGNIKSGINIFGVGGAATVQDISDADLTIAEAPTGKKFYAVTGGVKTGTGTKTLNPASETVAAGYYATVNLSAVDADLAVANIKTGVTIFGFLGAYDTTATPIAATRMKTGDEGWANGTKFTGSGTQTLSAANSTVNAGYYAATTLQTVDADLAVANIKTGVTIFGFLGTYDTTATPIAAARMKTGDVGWANGAQITGTGTKTLSAANSTVAEGYYAATTLQAVDADLAVGNIKTGVVIFGFTGTYDTEAVNPVVAGRMKTGDIAFVNGAKITGTGTKTLSAANSTVAEGYYAATTLQAVDADLAVGNIKNGVVIFGFTGNYDYEATNPIVAARLKTGDIGFVNGAKITGSGTQTLSNANDTVNAGYYAATTLSAVDADLAAANIKSGVVIFGFTGTHIGTLSQDIVASAVSAATGATSGGYYFTQTIATVSEYDIATTTNTFAASSMTVAVGFAHASVNAANIMKIRLYMDGTQVAESAYLPLTASELEIVLVGTRALSGSKICKITAYNYALVTRTLNITAGLASGKAIAAGIGVGSIKVAA